MKQQFRSLSPLAVFGATKWEVKRITGAGGKLLSRIHVDRALSPVVIGLYSRKMVITGNVPDRESLRQPAIIDKA
jgi:hypothetical protein